MPTKTVPTKPVLTTQTVLTWRVHLLRQQPRRLPRLLAAIVCVFFLSLILFRSAWLALLPTLATVFSLSEFLFPARYTLTMQSAKASYGATTLEIAWRDVRHAYLAEDGIKLSPLASRNARWEPLRGVFLRFGDSDKDEIIDTVRRLRDLARVEKKDV